MSSSTDETDRAGIHAVGAIFTRIGWIFREQPTSDFGIDAQAEKSGAGGEATGKLVGLQIKTGESYFRKRGDDFVFYGEERHLNYWLRYSLPVFLVLHNPVSGLTLWQKIDPHLVKHGKDGRWSIIVPAGQTLDQQHEPFIAEAVATDLPSIRRRRLVLDLPTIKDFSEQESVFFRVQDWVNKTLNFRGVQVIFNEDPDAEPDRFIEAWLPAYSIERFMSVHFPWLDWELTERVGEEECAFEMAEHILSVRVSAVGRAALTLDEFYAAELPPDIPPWQRSDDSGDDGFEWGDANTVD